MRAKIDERKQREAETVERLLRIEESAPAGDSVCERCGTRFMRREGTSGRFCSRQCYETPAPAVARTVVDDQEEFEVVWNGSR